MDEQQAQTQAQRMREATNEAMMAPGVSREVRVLLSRLPAYGRIYWRLLRDDRLTRGQRILAFGALAYTISPIDLVPGFIPVAGQLDDIAVALGGLRLLLTTLPSELAMTYLASEGLSLSQLDDDLRTLVRVTAALGWQGMRLLGGVSMTGTRALARGLRLAFGRRPTTTV